MASPVLKKLKENYSGEDLFKNLIFQPNYNKKEF